MIRAALAVQLLLLTLPASAEVSTIRVGLQYGLGYLPVVIAQSEGLIARRAAERGLSGLQISLVRFSGSTAMNEAILSNSIDLGTVGTAGALIIWEKTRGRGKVKSLCGVSTGGYILFTNRPDLKTLADFTPNDKIAVPAFNSPQAILLRVAAERTFGDTKRADAMIVNLPHPDATAAMLAGSTGIAGHFTTAPFQQMLQRDPKIHAVLNSRELLDGKDTTSTTLIATQAFADENPKAMEAVLAGIEDAIELIGSDPKRAAAIYLQSEKVAMAAPDIEALLTDGSTRYSTTPDGIMAWSRFMVAQGFLRNVPASWKEPFFPLVAGRSGS